MSAANDFHGEVWQPVAGYEDHYEVSDRGRVRSIERRVARCNGTDRRVRERILRPMTQAKTGYAIVVLSDCGVEKRHYIHVLVRQAFGGTAA